MTQQHTLIVNRGDNIGYALLEDLSAKRLVEDNIKDINIKRNPKTRTNTITYKYKTL